MLKQFIKENIVNPVVHDGASAILSATVKTADEKNNMCSIVYVDKDGKPSNKNNVQVRLTSANTWFPKAGDKVVVEDRGDLVSILGPAVHNYATELRERNKPRCDIHPEPSGCVGGCVF